MNKYYIPKIKEFYVGFEYEYLHKDNWISHEVYCYADIQDAHYDIELNKVRVKYLDKEDIESLGFKYYDKIEDSIYFKYKSFRLAFNPIVNKVEIVELGPCRFRGAIKNKSELKVVLKQIGIVNE